MLTGQGEVSVMGPTERSGEPGAQGASGGGAMRRQSGRSTPVF